ncbi:MAG: alpha-L-arabinofuranosidase C-terminal domain-containing protein [Bacteroidales bacterium]|nr:alpha-L-arabinofuranosidase C-terminal domain-containing protein [Bacteroidales bacterium]
MYFKFSAAFLSLFTSAILSFGQTDRRLELSDKQNGAEISPTMYGIFFEDINYGADGGLYAELIKNRSFEFPQNLMGWNTFGKVAIDDKNPAFEKNPNYVRLSDPGHHQRSTGLDNEGYFGIGLKKDAEYRFSVWARTTGENISSQIKVEFIASSNSPVAESRLNVNGDKWIKYTAILKSPITDDKCKVRIFLSSPNSVDLDHISLFPVETFNNHENGMRKDLALALADLKPNVFRFPGGCIVEGTELDTRYNWKNTIGEVENRPLNQNRWEYTFSNRYFPDYFQSYGLGFYEYFLLSEEIGAEPLPVLNCGLACQYQCRGPQDHAPVDSLQPFIDDALDLIEFANGDENSKWGKIRAKMGHPQPFNLKYIAIGNEQWGEEYPVRLEPFIKAIKRKYPKMNIIGSAGPSPDGKDFDYLWSKMKELKADLVDEHYYRSPEWFLSQAKRYDNYSRKSPKVFAGEYACHTSNRKNNFESALCEAAFMTGLERNADIVAMATYAPLFAHKDGWQWKPDLIWFDNLRLVKSINYYVQQLYSLNKGSNIASITENNLPVTGEDGLYASAVYDKNSNSYIVKIINTSDKAQKIDISLKGKKFDKIKSWNCTALQAPDLDAENTIEMPDLVAPRRVDMTINDKAIKTTMPSKCFYVYKIECIK